MDAERAAVSEEARALRRHRLAAAAVGALLALVWALPVSREHTWGWDESMHAELPAVRMLLAARAAEPGEAFGALLDCQQYPFAYPAALAALQGFTGVSELACRAFGRVLWALTCLGVFLLVQEVARRGRGGADHLAPWLAMAFAAASPMGLAFSGTLFLEVPFACCAVFALRAWIRRGPEHGRGRELIAGAWVTLAFFTKFNYGAMLGAGLLVDLLVEGVGEQRSGRGRAWLRRAAWLALVPAVALAWWFLLPIPDGPARGMAHARAFLGFMAGNQEVARTSWDVRAGHWLLFLVFAPRVLLLAGAGLAGSLGAKGSRPLWLVFLALAVPPALHPFHLDRLLLPGSLALWGLAGLGLARLLPGRLPVRAACAACLAAAAAIAPSWDSSRIARSLVEERHWEYALAQLPALRSLHPARPLATAGPRRAEADALLDLAAGAVGPRERIGWIGISSELSPAALHIGLVARGGSPERLLRDAHRPSFITLEGVDPGWDGSRLADYAAGFDVILATDPPDLKARSDRAFTAGYVERLVGELGWSRESAGVALIGPRTVELFACRPSR